MPYSFPDEIKSIIDYYEKIDTSLSAKVSTGGPSQSDEISSALAGSDPLYATYLRRSIPIMFCMAWEKFVRELSVIDPPRHQTCFQNRAEKVLRKWYNAAIREIAVIRHCIIHNDGCANREYVAEFGTYNLGEKIAEIDKAVIDRHYEIFLKAFERITAQPLTSLP